MAACTFAISTPSTANASSYVSGAFTPAANDLLVVFATLSGTDTGGSLTGSVVSTFTKIATAAKAASVDTSYLFVANSLTTATSQTVTWAGNAATGCILQVWRISGMSRLGSAAVKQTGQQDNQAASGTPAPVFGASCITTNPTLGLVSNATSPATMTPPASWTEGGDVGYATPTTGAETVFRNSGFTGTTVTWGGTSASAFCSIVVELDASALVNVQWVPSTERPRAEPRSVVGY